MSKPAGEICAPKPALGHTNVPVHPVVYWHTICLLEYIYDELAAVDPQLASTTPASLLEHLTREYTPDNLRNNPIFLSVLSLCDKVRDLA